MEIYLDNASTTKVFDESAKIAYEVMTKSFGNPSSVHGMGLDASHLLECAREKILKSAGADSKKYNLTFTSSGTDADNLAVLGTTRLLTKKGNRILMGSSEHPAVFSLKAELEKIGYEVLLVPNKGGEIDFDFLEENLNEKTVLITHMLANNETGALYDIKRLCKLRDEKAEKCLVHTDAVQAYLKTDKSLAACGADLVSVSAHKIHAPKGVGALIYKKSIRISPTIFGGEQESGLHSGTEALPSICAFANSAEILSKKLPENLKYVETLSSYANEKIRTANPQITINTPKSSIPHILSLTLPGIKSEVMLRYLSEKGIYVSAGSACSSKKKENRVLHEFGLSSLEADTTIRVSLDIENTKEELDIFVDSLCDGINSLAKIKT